MRLSKIIFLFCAVLILSPSIVFAQADFFQKGESGLGFLIGYAEGDRSNTIQGAAFLTYSGILDVGVYFGSVRLGNSSRRSSATGYHVGIYPLRESKTGGIKFNFGVFAEHSRIRRDNFNTVGISLFKKMGGASSSFFQPKVSLLKVWQQGSSNTGDLAYQFDFTLGWRKSISIITATLSILNGEDATIIGFTAGLTFAFGKK